MAINTTIQTGVKNLTSFSPTLCVDSNGRLYTAYCKSFTGTDYLAVAYSDDAGASWLEVQTAVQAGSVFAAIDSTDKIHIVYQRDGLASSSLIVGYRTFSSGTISSEEIVYNGTAAGDRVQGGVVLAIDSNDIPHIAWGQDVVGSNTNVFYSNRSGGSWAARTLLSDTNSGAGETENDVRIAIDSQNQIHVVWRTDDSTDALLSHAFWDGATWSVALLSDTGGNNIDYYSWMVVDSNDNVHLVYIDTEPAPDAIKYMKYTESTNSWGLATTIENTNPSPSGFPTIGIDSNDNLYVIYRNTSNNISLLTYTGSWSASSEIIDDSSNDETPTFHTPLFPVLGGVSTQRATSGYQFIYFLNSISDELHFYSSTGLTLQTPIDKAYSRKASASLPSSDSALTTLFTTTGYSNVATDDAVYEDQSATDQYAIVQFKNKADNSSDQIHVSWTGKTNIAPTTSTVYLQIYNRNSTTWETLDSDSTSSANVNFTLTGSKTSSLSNYYDGNNWVSCRVYQLAQ